MANVTWTRDTAAHLLRRAGFGATSQELDSYEQMGLGRAVDTLVEYESVSNAALDAALAGFDFNFERYRDLLAWWITRIVLTARPLEEKMTFFWHNYFATSVQKVQPEDMKAQNDLLRSFALGNFRDMLVAVSKDPAMLDWLDNRTNRVGHPNENYGRELMELFTLGIGNYTETDVQEVARCFTGWTIRNDQYQFVAGAHDNGSKTVLGNTIAAGGGENDGVRVCDILAAHPACATYLSRRLLEFFVTPEPSNALVRKFADVYTSTGYDVREVMRAILKSDEFYAEENRFALVKSPTEYAVGALKSLDATIDTRRLGTDVAFMGQQLFAPPDVGGWDGGLDWISTTTLLNRANWADSVVADRTNDNRNSYVDVDKVLGTGDFSKANKVVSRLLDRMGPLTLSKKERKPLKDYLLTDDNGVKQSAFTLDATTKDKKVRGLIHQIMTLPEYHLN